MILIIDNYDSFTYNLLQLVGGYRSDVKAVRNDALTVKEIDDLSPDGIIISPGPGFPKDAGISVDAVSLGKKYPILGVCLGHQSICEAFGAKVTYASEVVHGIARLANLDTTNILFKDCEPQEMVGRYHSLAVVPESMPDILETTSTTDNGIIMGLRHREAPMHGVQFHPESVLTEGGYLMLGNWLEETGLQGAAERAKSLSPLMA